MERILFVMQRASAAILAPLVIVHLGLIMFAVRGGLSADEILARTQGNAWWAVFYGVFVIAVAVHAPIGLRNILREWTTATRAVVDWPMAFLALLLLGLGLRAVAAII